MFIGEGAPFDVGYGLYVSPPMCCSEALMWDGLLPLASVIVVRVVPRVETVCGGYSFAPPMAMGVQ